MASSHRFGGVQPAAASNPKRPKSYFDINVKAYHFDTKASSDGRGEKPKKMKNAGNEAGYKTVPVIGDDDMVLILSEAATGKGRGTRFINY
jgi:hypothetical protein